MCNFQCFKIGPCGAQNLRELANIANTFSEFTQFKQENNPQEYESSQIRLNLLFDSASWQWNSTLAQFVSLRHCVCFYSLIVFSRLLCQGASVNKNNSIKGQ